jgi:Ca2+-binding RTX toxin-like protein
MAVLTVDTVLSGPALGLTSGLDDLFVYDTGGRMVLYGFNRGQSRVVELTIDANGDLTHATTLQLAGSVAVGNSVQLGVMALGGGNALTLAGIAPSAGQAVTLSPTGGLGAQTILPDLLTLRVPQSVTIGPADVIVTGGFDGGLLHYADTGHGYHLTTSLADDATRYLADLSASVTYALAGEIYVATASASEDGLNLARVTATGLDQTAVLGATEGLPIGTPADLAVVQRLNETVLVVASTGTSSVSTVLVQGTAPLLADHIFDSDATRFSGATTVAALTYGDAAYVAAGGAEGGVSLLTVLPGGRLVHLDSLAEDETLPLDQIGALEMQVQAGALHIYAGALTETGLTHITYDLSDTGSVLLADGSGTTTGTALGDQIIGTETADGLSGLGGDDILLDGAGADWLMGGAGADLFVFSADQTTDTITDFERGIDRLDLSAFDFLGDVSQLTVTPTATGATLVFRDETIEITTADALPLTSGELTNADILNVDRPSFLHANRTITGGPDPDTLTGGTGSDTIDGAGGNDTLTGNGGDDSLLGGGGLDLLYGNAANDTLNGQGGADTLVGGAGDDWLDGGDGADVIYGDDWV